MRSSRDERASDALTRVAQGSPSSHAQVVHVRVSRFRSPASVRPPPPWSVGEGVVSEPAPPPPPPIAAATLVVLREAAGGLELLMLERAATLAFAPGALVFPGGRVDPGDRALAATFGDDDDGERAARIAAIRETIEEAGVPIAIVPTPGPAQTDRIRAALQGGQSFAQALADAGCRLQPDRLVAFARWLPAHRLPRIFDTRFYLATLPPDAPDARADGAETAHLFWATATAILGTADSGATTVIYPTRRNLERLSRFGTFAEAVADAAAHPVRTITPYPEERDGRLCLCIPEGLGYPVTAEPMERAVRG